MRIFPSNEFRIGAIVTVIITLIAFLFPSPFREAEKILLTAKYHSRGVIPADSSVVIVYLDNNDIDALGGLPIKRNYYALLIHALHDLGAAAIGVDIAFTEPDAEHAEYDDLLASVVKLSGNVVLGGYFRSVSNDSLSQADPIDSSIDRFMTGLPPSAPVKWGTELERPFPQLLNAAARFGHTNFTDNNNIPIIIAAYNGKYLQSFGLTTVLAGLSPYPPNSLVNSLSQGLRIPGSPLGGDGDIMLNYPGGIQSFNLISAVNFLKGYDESKMGGVLPDRLSSIKGKIVLVGIIAEGRSLFVETPFNEQFPSIGMHATFISNVFQYNFLHGNVFGQSARMWELVLALIMGLICTLLMMFKREIFGLLGVIAGLAAVMAL